MFLEMKLKDAGHSVESAENGREALEILERSAKKKFDLVLMDVQMPIMDGLEATKRIRMLPPPVSGITIIALTAFALDGNAQKFTGAGMDGYVTKPVEWDELARTISRTKCIRSTSRSNRCKRP